MSKPLLTAKKALSIGLTYTCFAHNIFHCPDAVKTFFGFFSVSQHTFRAKVNPATLHFITSPL
jgi:hypothetical protein